MRVYLIESHGGPEALGLRERPVPEPGPGEARVRVLAVALNHLDLWVRRGVPGHTFPLPLIPGCDIAGTITALGPGPSRWTLGQQVLAAPGIGCGGCPACLAGRDHLCRSYGIFGETRDGGCAEAVVIPQSHLLAPPTGVSLAEAVACPLTLLTAWHMIAARAQVRPGETVLVQAGAGGVGVMAIQVARLFGATVIATAGSPEKALLARSLGAGTAILYRETEFTDEVRRLTARRGVDVVIDSVGSDTFERSLRILAKGGRLVTCGATAGADVRVDLKLIFFKGLSILGSTMGSRGELEEAMAFVGRGIRPAIDRIFAMEDLPRAHARLESRQAVGKIVVAGFGVDFSEITAGP